NRIDLHALAAMDGGGRFREVMPMLTDPAAFEGMFTPGGRRGCRLRSRGMEGHRGAMRSFGVAEDAGSRPVFAMKAFTTAKKDGRSARLVLDARPLNDAMQRPPAMDLPAIHGFVREVKRHRYAMQCDGVSYFYQFPVHASISRYFGIGMNGRDMLLRVLCMGWSWAPCIAQRASNVLVQGLGLAWVDNFLVLGGTRDEAEQKVATFRDRAAAARVEVRAEGGDTLWEVQTRFVCVGIEFDLAADEQRHRLDPAWASKWAAAGGMKAVLAGKATARQFASVFGGAVWATDILGVPRCHFAALLAFAGRLGSRMAEAELQAWDDIMDVPPSVRREIGALRKVVVENAWVGGDAAENGEVLWTDASSREWAALVEAGGEFVDGAQGVFDGPFAGVHINVKEMWALAEGVVRLCWTPGRQQCRVDNATVVGAVCKGSSSSYAANRILSRAIRVAERRRIVLCPGWVPSGGQLADPYTRGTSLPR
ncbi:hypothetical protein DIPPA_13320, partial [Diplonema papillatum]